MSKPERPRVLTITNASEILRKWHGFKITSTQNCCKLRQKIPKTLLFPESLEMLMRGGYTVLEKFER